LIEMLHVRMEMFHVAHDRRFTETSPKYFNCAASLTAQERTCGASAGALCPGEFADCKAKEDLVARPPLTGVEIMRG
jgi:hypothetical protein